MGKKSKGSKKKKKNKGSGDPTDNQRDVTLVAKKSNRKFIEPEEWYPAKFAKYTVNDGKHGEYLMLFFEILDGPLQDNDDDSSAKGANMVMIAGTDPTPKSKIWKVLEVVTGDTPEIGQEFDLKSYLGTKVRIMVDDNGKDGEDHMQGVDKIKPHKKKKKGKKKK